MAVDWSQFQPIDSGTQSRPPMFVAGPKPQGMAHVGNIDIANRPVAHNPDGTISTVRSISIGTDDGEVLIPTVSPDGKLLTNKQAIELYRKTGQNLGVFDSVPAANAYAEALHEQQAKMYAGDERPAVDWSQFTPLKPFGSPGNPLPGATRVPAPEASEPTLGERVTAALGATGDQPYGEGAGYLIDNPITRALGQAGNEAAMAANQGLYRFVLDPAQYLARKAGVDTDFADTFIHRANAPLAEQAKALQTPKGASVGEAATAIPARVAGAIATAMATGGVGRDAKLAQAGERALQEIPGLGDMVVKALGGSGARTAAVLGAQAAEGQEAGRAAQGQATSGTQLGNTFLAHTAANLLPVGEGMGPLVRPLVGAASGAGGQALTDLAAGQRSPLSQYLISSLIAAGLSGLAAGGKAPRVKAAPASDTAREAVRDALRKAGFTDEQIADFERSGAMDETLRAATQAPPLQGPPPEAPAPAAAVRALSAPEPKAPEAPRLPPPPRKLPPPTIEVDSQGRAVTNAQAMEQARMAEATAQARRMLGLTPDVEQAQQARAASDRARVLAEAETPGGIDRALAEIEGKRPAVAPEPEPGQPPIDPEAADWYFNNLEKEIGWDQVGGQIMRAGDEAAGSEGPLGIGADPGRAGGTVVGRTKWIGMPRADNEGESSFWRDRPPNARLTPAKAKAALAKYRAGEKLKPIEQRFVDYAKQQAKEYAQEYAVARAEHAAEQQDLDEEALTKQHEAFQDEALGVAPEDESEALTFQQWMERAHNAGVPFDAVRGALEASPSSFEGAVRGLARLIHDRERGNGTDARATAGDRAVGLRPGGEGRAVPDETTGTGIAEPQGPRSDLFPEPTNAERVRAAREAKDAQRNGLNARGPTPAFSGTDLGATPRGEAPEQVDLTTPEAQSTTYERDAHQLQRGHTTEPESGDIRSTRTVPGQLDLFVPTRGGRSAAQAEAPKLARLFQRAKVVTTGEFKSGIKTIRGWQDAAHIIAPLRKYPQEQFLAVVADAAGKPLAVLRHTIGMRDSSLVDTGNVFGSIAQIPGARQVWFAHNHPSGRMEQSGADRTITRRLHDLMRGSGITTHGMILIGPGHATATHFDPRAFEGPESTGAGPGEPITAAARTGSVPIVERALRKIGPTDRMAIASPNDLQRAVRLVAGNEPGVIFVDNQRRVVGFLPMTAREMARLRTGDPATGAAHVAAVANEATAAGAIPVVRASDVDAARNLNKFFVDANLTPLDIAEIEPDGSIHSLAMKREPRVRLGDFESQEPAPRPVDEVSEAELSPEDLELVRRTRERAAAARDDSLTTDQLRQESIERGEREAGELGLRGAVVEALGPDRMDNVHFVHDADGLPEDVRRRGKPIKRGNVLYGLHTPDGQSFIFTRYARTPERAAWTAIHEVGGHGGFQALAEQHPDVKVGNRTVREALDAARKTALQNPTVRRLAEAIAGQRGSKDLPRMAEEAMAELQAAARSGRWDELARKYGVEVPKAIRQGVQGAIANFVRRIKAIVDAIYRKLTGKKGEAFTDADVHDMLDSMWESARGERGRGDEAFSEEPQDRADTFGRGVGGPAIPEPEVELPPRAPGESQTAYHARVIRESRMTMLDGLKASLGLRTWTPLEKRQQTIGRGGLRAMWARNQRSADKASVAFHKAQRVFDKAGKAANLEAIHQWETGQKVTSAAHRLFFKAMQSEFQKRIDAIRAIAPGTLENVIENYFPHLWEDPIKAGKWYQREYGKRPLEGNKSFLKQRVHATIKDGIAAGLKPVSTNPVDLVLAKMAQMDKFLALHEFRKDLQDRGWLKEMEPGQRVPYGYARVDDPAFVKAAGLQGYFAVPEPIARDLNNYLSPSLYRFRGFKAFRRLENLVMMGRLGWSMFHAGFTTLDNLVMHADVGLRYALQGDVKRSLVTLAKTPLSIVWSPFEGGKLNREWLGLDKADANTAALLDALEQGGAHYKMDTSEYNQGLRRFIRGLQQGDYGKALRSSLSAAGETGSWIIHHKLVPNQKMAARLLLAKFALDRVAAPLGKERGDYAGIIDALSPDALKQIMGDVVKNVDDRLGQMNYNNQFWNKTAREIAQTVIGAVGWQVGTVRTVTGGVRDIQRLWKPEKLAAALDKEGKITDADMGRISGRLTYLISLALMMGGLNAATQYLLTGKGPSEPKDYFFPKTGRKNADGSDERLQFPTYWMDHYKLATHPLQTAEHKIHPIFGMFMEAISNQDYYGVQIHNPHASWAEQAKEIAEYVAKGFMPYSWTNRQKIVENEGGIARQVAGFAGITTAPASVSRTPFQAFVAHNGHAGFGHELRTRASAEHSRKVREIIDEVRQGGTPDLTGLSRRDLGRIRRESRVEVPELQFQRMGLEDKLDAWDMATPKERRKYHLREHLMRSRPTRSDVFRRLPDDERQAILEKLAEIRGDH